jgi:predicted dehydrogenase
MRRLRFAVVGAGFWAPYQLHAWQSVGGVECVAVCDRDRAKAEALASRSPGHVKVYTDPDFLLRNERLDFVDVVTSAEAHGEVVHFAAMQGVAAVCQKPLAPTYAEAVEMTETCRRAGVPLLVHENWRWQRPIRGLKKVLDDGDIGPVFRARVQYSNSFPVFENQPFLKTLEQFILADMGPHILDVARFLFGETDRVYCQTDRVHPDIRGEDVATVMLRMGRVTVTCELSYASRLEYDRFPETFALVEGEHGSAELRPDYWVHVTTTGGTQARRYEPPQFSWAAPRYALVQTSMVPCLRNLLAALRGEAPAETTAADNLRTLQLVFAAYESARIGQAVPVTPYEVGGAVSSPGGAGPTP